MPFIGGGELRKVLRDAKKFTEKEIKFYSVQLIHGLKYLHDSNIMHRDLKLENMLLDENGYLKIVDFGVAEVLRHNQVAYDFTGTPAYFAPEILKGDGYNMAADWWAVGIILYQMLTGVLPFHNRNIVKQNQSIVEN